MNGKGTMPHKYFPSQPLDMKGVDVAMATTITGYDDPYISSFITNPLSSDVTPSIPCNHDIFIQYDLLESLSTSSLNSHSTSHLTQSTFVSTKSGGSMQATGTSIDMSYFYDPTAAPLVT